MKANELKVGQVVWVVGQDMRCRKAATQAEFRGMMNGRPVMRSGGVSVLDGPNAEYFATAAECRETFAAENAARDARIAEQMARAERVAVALGINETAV